MEVAVAESGLRPTVHVEDRWHLPLLGGPEDPRINRRAIARFEGERLGLPDRQLLPGFSIEFRELTDATIHGIQLRRHCHLHCREDDALRIHLEGLDAPIPPDDRFRLPVSDALGPEMDRASFGDEMVDSVPDPLGVGVHASQPNVGIQAILEAPIKIVQASRRTARGADQPKVIVGCEASREVVSEERKLPVVGRPSDGGDLHVVLRELPLLLGGHLVDEEVLEIGASVVRLRDVRDLSPVVRPGRLRHIELTLRELLRLFRLEVDLKNVLADIVDEALVVEPEVDPANRPDVLLVLADIREEQPATTVGGPRHAFDSLFPPQEEAGLAAVCRDHVKGVSFVVFTDLPFRGEEDSLSVRGDLRGRIFPGGRELSRFAPGGRDDP